MTRPICFLSDFGLSDIYVGVVKAVILDLTPDARIVDLTHDIPPQDVRAGAFALRTAIAYLPADAVVLAVVDPGVGTERRPVLVQTPSGRTFVGPDNGLLAWATAPDDVCITLDQPRFWLPAISTTFQGRDLFGPVAAHVARGVPLAALGSPDGPIQRLPFPSPRQELGPGGRAAAAHGEVVHVDRYGNLITSLDAASLPPDPVVEIRGRTIVGLAPHFQAGAGSLIALIGSAGLLKIAMPNGSAAATLGVGGGEPVTVIARTVRT